MKTTRTYHERLTPSFWIMGAALFLAPMITLVFVRIEPTISLTVGAVAAIAVIAALIALSPTVSVVDGELRAGRAHIPVELLGEPAEHRDDDARAVRGRDLDARAWHLIRGGIDGIVTVPVTDPDDPTSVWVVSSRTPDRLAAAVRAAQVTQRTHGR